MLKSLFQPRTKNSGDVAKQASFTRNDNFSDYKHIIKNGRLLSIHLNNLLFYKRKRFDICHFGAINLYEHFYKSLNIRIS